ncbi:MAG: hypothetical protein O7F70_02450 [Gemmatimonadetes bacterium]|nr:hypothetical protein [Gemmatimonadota bacterium]
MKMRRSALGVLALLWGCAGEDIAAPLDHVAEFAVTGGFPVVIVRSGPAPGAGVLAPIFDNFVDAIDAVAPGGTIRVIPGSYVVEGVEIAKPVTIQGLGNGTAVIQTSVALSAFFVNGYEAGTVLIDGLTFDFDTPTGPTTATRSYPIRAHGTYDQLIIQNSIFNIDPLARGSIFTEQSTVATAATFVDNVEITGGVFGVAVGNNHTEVTNSHISGAGNGVYYFGTPTPPTGRVEGSVFVDCGNQCVRVGGGGDVDVIPTPLVSAVCGVASPS